jgi:hypothetical protein
VRGATFWVAAGDYGGQRFTAPTSGTTPVTINGATTASHGPAGDWIDSFAGRATFIGGATVSTSYWTFNGQPVPGCKYPEGSGDSGDPCYTMHFWNKTNPAGTAVFISASNLTFKYVEMEGTGQGFPNNTSTSDRCLADSCGSWGDNAITTGNVSQGQDDNLYVGYSYVHHTGNTQFQLNWNYHNNATFEYDWVSYNHTGQNGIHDEAFSILFSNLIVRYNVFQDITFNGIVTDAASGSVPLSNWAVYGNIIFWDPTYAALNGQFNEAIMNNGIVDMLGENMSGYIYVYNNTIAGFNNSRLGSCGGSGSTTAVSGGNGNGPSSGSPTVVVVNNLWYDSACEHGNFPSYCEYNSSAHCTWDYNAWYQGGAASNSNWSDSAEPHGYAVSGNVSPFANFSASTIAGFEPAAPDPFVSHPGSLLLSPYNMDMLGAIRGENGTWDRGAMQTGSATFTRPAPPQNLHVTSVQ